MKNQLLIYAIGNPARGDDGLGMEFLNQLPQETHFDIKHNYQFNVEDAEVFSSYDSILVVDAHKYTLKPFEVTKIEPSFNSLFSTHGVTSKTILTLCEDLYSKRPETHLLAIRGYEFELKESLSQMARENLHMAKNWFLNEFVSNSRKISELTL